jgi:hypothetical protein
MPSQLALKALAYMQSQIGQKENPRGSNWGHPVQDYLYSIGIDFPAAWCAALVYWSYEQASKELKIDNPVPRTGGSLKMFQLSKPENRILVSDVLAGHTTLMPGDIGVQDHGHGTGHTVIVEMQVGDRVKTVEGNTNDTGSREGFEVERKESLKMRAISSFIGFLRF